MKLYLILSTVVLYLVGTVLGYLFAHSFVHWFVEPFNHNLAYTLFVTLSYWPSRIGSLTGPLFAVGPLCVLLAGRRTQSARWALVFELLALCVSFGTALFWRIRIVSAITHAVTLPGSPTYYFDLYGIPVESIFFAGPLAALALALLKRLISPGQIPPTPIK